MMNVEPNPVVAARDADHLPAGRTLMHAADSVTRRIGGDVRSTLMATSVFTLQVAHPIVGAGVAEHSLYRVDPWGRLRDIDASGRRFLWTDERAARAEGARLRFIHRGIKGIDAKGRRYHSLDPHGYGWVHMVFLDSMIRQRALFDDPLEPAECERLFCEWYEAALFLGLRDRDLPPTLAAYHERFEYALAHELEYTAPVAHLLGDRAGPPRPAALAWLAPRIWSVAIRPAFATSQWLALAGLPSTYRARIAEQHPWGPADELRLVRLASWVRAVVPRLPERVRLLPDARRVARERAEPLRPAHASHAAP